MNKQLLLLVLIVCAGNLNVFAQIDSTFQDIEEVVISSKREKKIVFEDPKYYIVDFTVNDDHAILLMKNFGNYYVYELDEDMNFRHKLKLNINADFLYSDCFGNSHVVTKDSAYLIEYDTLGLLLSEAHRRRQFMGAMNKCVGSTSEKIVFEQKSNYNRNQTFYTVDIDSGDRNIVYELKDEELDRSMREAAAKLFLMKYLEEDRIREGNLNGSIADDVNTQRINNGKYDRRLFVESHLFRPKYNPLFVVSDTLFIFDHLNGKAVALNDDGDELQTIPISYHLTKKWDKKVYADKVDREFYAVKLRKGVQQLVRLSFEEDGQNSSSEITKHAYPKKVIVRGGFAYYTYKPYFDANLNKLYRQKL